MRKKGTKKGFTLIELSFAILFISVLLITLTLIASEIISIYRKGYAIKTVNSVGRDLIDEFSSSISQSPPSNLSHFCEERYKNTDARTPCDDDNGQKFIYQQFFTGVKNNSNLSESANPNPYGGIFCTGKYSYIWRTGFIMNSELYSNSSNSAFSGDFLRFKYSYNGTETTVSDFRLLRVEDTSRSLCANSISNTAYASTIADGGGMIEMPGSLSSEPLELLAESDNPVALFNLVVFPPAQASSTKKFFYSSSFILATISGGVNIMTNGNYCIASLNSADASYCAINKFNFSMQANGG